MHTDPHPQVGIQAAQVNMCHESGAAKKQDLL